MGRRRGICCEKTLLIPNLLEGNRVYFSQSEKQHSHKMFSAANREVHGEEDVARQYRGPSLSEVRLNRNRIKHIKKNFIRKRKRTESLVVLETS